MESFSRSVVAASDQCILTATGPGLSWWVDSSIHFICMDGGTWQAEQKEIENSLLWPVLGADFF